MMEDDDMFLVIVGDESGEVDIPLPIQIKQEYLEEEENVPVEDLLEKAEKHGQYIKIEIEPKTELEYLDSDEPQFNEYLETIKPEEPSEDYELDYTAYDDEYVPEEIERKPKREKSRRAMLKVHEQKSFVEDLRDQYPELRKNKKLLVKTLCEIMRSVKRPPLPQGYFVQNEAFFDCPQCGHQSETLPAAGRHYQEKHGPRYLICYACGVDFRSTTNLYKHEKRCTARDKRVVLKARAAFLGNKGRSRPYLDYRFTQPPRVSFPRFTCTECSAEFYTKNNLMSHTYLHRGERPFQCHECPAAYTSYSALVRHVKKHSDEQYICDHCQRSFKMKAALVAHMDTHRAVRKFGCDLCERRFAQKQALQLHVDRVHRNLPPPHACQICPKRYPRMSLLKTHMKNEHGLAIMTRKMFFKKLPMLSEAEMKQAAKIVFKSDTPRQNYFKKLDEDNIDLMEDVKNEPTQENNFILPDNPNAEDIVEYFKQMSGYEDNVTDSAKTYVIENGEVVEIRIESEQ
ncbi:zinc finger protein 354C [Manduca sexta]|uniref:zinc finger protein 354C n=1 Tax=Manduca sexta TaxID=7130 RepID=UPI00188ED8F4|nr:zinc finger protein 354C [Manduca sexta]XP_030041315.2 zinc finger protein 354C [Manduca sexta]